MILKIRTISQASSALRSKMPRRRFRSETSGFESSPRERILELYLNEVEWGRGVYGADAACRYCYRTPARSIDREASARLAAILPLPLRRSPDRMNRYSELILKRTRQ